VPVRVGGVWVNPGDLLHGDRNGVTTIPRDLAAVVVEGCAGYMDAEAVVLNYLKSGGVNTRGYIVARDECKRRLGELGKKLKSRAPAGAGV
jgi:4-hydroxy-4-methyl-2-oxoglutarate aldolase